MPHLFCEFPDRIAMSANPPGFLKKVRAFFGASAREGASVLRGDPEMPASEIARRRAICGSNICGRYEAHDDRCIACGCNVAKKIAWRTASCPEGHWQAVAPAAP
ncbi:MAG: hypothetical protein ACREKL_14320 [Chthoniobacterales bacterium]